MTRTTSGIGLAANPAPPLEGAMVKRTELLLVTLWVLAVASLAYLATGKPDLGIDDAQIFFTYAQHFASGHGLIYSQGVAPAEGYTSSLWMLVCALMFYLRLNEPGVLAVSLLLLIVTQLMALRIIGRLLQGRQRRFATIVYVTLVTLSPAYLTWTTITLMDTGMWSTLVVAMVFVVLFAPATRRGWFAAALPFALAPLARPEAMAVAPALLVLLAIKVAGKKEPIAPVAWLFASVIATTLALTLFRLHYFGYPLPNTYYAKVSSSMGYNLLCGLAYLGKFLVSGYIAALAALVCVPFARRLLGRAWHALLSRTRLALSDGADDACQMLAAICLLLLALPIVTGGDHFAFSRFYQPAYPVLCLLLAIWAAKRAADAVSRQGGAGPSRQRWFVLPGVCGLVLLLSMASLRDSWLFVARHGSPLAREFSIGTEGEAAGKTLDALFAGRGQARPTIGVVAAGGVGRTYQGPIIDLMGLNNRYIAHFPGNREGVKNHAAFEKAAFYNLPVDVLLSAPNSEWNEEVLKRIFYDPQFVAQWRYGAVYLKSQPQRRYESFYSRKLIDSIGDDSPIGFYDTLVFNKADARWEKAGTSTARQPAQDEGQAARVRQQAAGAPLRGPAGHTQAAHAVREGNLPVSRSAAG